MRPGGDDGRAAGGSRVERARAGYPPDRSAAGRVLDARLHLLDRQVLDRDGVPVTTVDDIELVDRATGAPDPGGRDVPVISALLTGAVLATRIAGGRPPASRWLRIGWHDVADIGTALRLGVAGGDLNSYYNKTGPTPQSAVGYARVIIPIGRTPKRLDCNRLYELEIQRLKAEIEMLLIGLE